MASIIPFQKKKKQVRLKPEEKKQLADRFQSLLKTHKELKDREKEIEWKIRVKCQREIQALETLRVRLQSLEKDIRGVSQKLSPKK